MMTIAGIIILQVIIAVIVLFVLMHLLDHELQKAAIEKFMSIKTNPAVKIVRIYNGTALRSKIEEELKTLVKDKFINSEVVFEQLKSLKGGLIIKIADDVLDFSVSSRLENFWL